MPGVVGAAERGASRVGGMCPFVVLYGVWSASAGFLRRLSWRRRHLVVGRRRLVVCLLLAFGLTGLVCGGPLESWAAASRLAGHGRLRGQILVRPPIGSGAVRSALVRLVPVAPAGRLAGLLFVLGASETEVVAPDVDHAGRWSTVRPVAGWSYAVVVEAESCPVRLAGLADALWLRSVRVDHLMESCWPRGRSPQWSSGRLRPSSGASDVLSLM